MRILSRTAIFLCFAGLPTGAQSMASYADLLGRVLDHLGVSHSLVPRWSERPAD